MSLKERRELVALAEAAADGAGTLITLTRASGSSYRAPGARLLVLPDGRTAGTISGGCLEADLLRKAAWMTAAGAAMQRYDTSYDETAEMPYGLGCGGEVELLLEPAGTPEAAAAIAAMRDSLGGAWRRMLTVLPTHAAATSAALGRIVAPPALGATAALPALGRIVLDERDDVIFASEHLPTEQVVALRALLRGSFRAAPADTRVRRPAPVEQPASGIFREQLLPAQRLVIFGAGEDCRPLVRLGAQMGWTVVVADGRAQLARPERFPEATEVIALGSGVAQPATAADAVVVMTHSYEQDRALLTQLLPVTPRYLGLLGARHRSALLLQEASAAAGIPLEEAVGRVHAPVGLSFGSDGPEAIALSITAHIQAVLEGVETDSRRMDAAEVQRHLRNGAASPRDNSCALSA